MYPHAINLQLVSTIGAACMALLVIAIRLRAARKPTSARKIVIPPLAMSTGFLMFLFPQTHIPWTYALCALLAGFVFSYPLIRTSKFEVRGREIYLKRSKAFPLILLGLLAIRLALHSYVERFISLEQTGAVFFILAYGMIVPWRIAMYRKYAVLKRSLGGNRSDV
ncbi:CcdC family protein [Effusibacillus pohliae]|uniref:CcdC family protein n=1 Tax=Effusibacillus pohliae TaxID=232270 RepID=UPI00037727A3|nr:cytochrome c biogenesis protein CcdC [Effusibacillus pohliae]